jgi:hypothetical protein
LETAKQLPAETAEFYEQFRSADLETLALFHERGPKRNRAWLEARRSDKTHVEQEYLNDLAVLARPVRNAPASIDAEGPD